MLTNKLRIVAIMVSVFLLSSCGLIGSVVETGEAEIVQLAVQGERNFRTAECIVGDISRSTTVQANWNFRTESIHYRHDVGGIVNSRSLNNRQEVSKGDVLLEVIFDERLLNDELEKLLMNLYNAENFRDAEREQRQENIANLAARLTELSPSETQITQLRIERAKLELESYLYNTGLQINNILAEIERVQEQLRGVVITAPADGVVFNIVHLNPGDEISPNTFIMTFMHNQAARLHITADPAQFRYNQEVEITIGNNDAAYPGRIVSNPAVIPGGGNRQFIVEFDSPPNPMYLVGNRLITVSGNIFELNDVTKLPTSSIFNENNNRYVRVLANDVVKRRFVQVGVFNNQFSEIISGVRPGDRVLD